MDSSKMMGNSHDVLNNGRGEPTSTLNSPNTVGCNIFLEPTLILIMRSTTGHIEFPTHGHISCRKLVRATLIVSLEN